MIVIIRCCCSCATTPPTGRERLRRLNIHFVTLWRARWQEEAGLSTWPARRWQIVVAVVDVVFCLGMEWPFKDPRRSGRWSEQGRVPAKKVTRESRADPRPNHRRGVRRWPLLSNKQLSFNRSLAAASSSVANFSPFKLCPRPVAFQLRAPNGWLMSSVSQMGKWLSSWAS